MQKTTLLFFIFLTINPDVVVGAEASSSSEKPKRGRPQTVQLWADSDGRFHCTQCPEIFSKRYNLNQHLKIHEGKKLKCPEPGCNKSFDRLTNLRVHHQNDEIHDPVARQYNKIPRKNRLSDSLHRRIFGEPRRRKNIEEERRFSSSEEEIPYSEDEDDKPRSAKKKKLVGPTVQCPFSCGRNFISYQALASHCANSNQHKQDPQLDTKLAAAQQLFARTLALANVRPQSSLDAGSDPSFTCPNRACREDFPTNTALRAHIRNIHPHEQATLRGAR